MLTRRTRTSPRRARGGQPTSMGAGASLPEASRLRRSKPGGVSRCQHQPQGYDSASGAPLGDRLGEVWDVLSSGLSVLNRTRPSPWERRAPSLRSSMMMTGSGQSVIASGCRTETKCRCGRSGALRRRASAEGLARRPGLEGVARGHRRGLSVSPRGEDGAFSHPYRCHVHEQTLRVLASGATELVGRRNTSRQPVERTR